MRLRTERVDASTPTARDGVAYLPLLVRGDYLSLNEGPAPVGQKLDGAQVILFQRASAAAMWAVLTAWDDLVAGKTPKTYQIRAVRYQDAASSYTLKIVEGPVLCSLSGAIEAGQFWIPAQGLEKPGSTIMTRPTEPAQRRQPRR